MSAEHRFVYVTTADRAEAHRLGRLAVERRLAACANVLDGMSSVYVWQGRVEEASEAVLILKTRADRVAALIQALREGHSYTCPAIVSLPILEANPDTLRWIDEVLGSR